MQDYDALRAAWPTSGTTLQKLATINAIQEAKQDIADVSVDVIQRTLGAKKLSVLASYAASPPANAVPVAVVNANYFEALISGSDGPTVKMSQPNVMNQVQQGLQALVSDPQTGITEQDAVNLLALSVITTQIPWWQAHGFDKPIGVADLIAAGGLF